MVSTCTVHTVCTVHAAAGHRARMSAGDLATRRSSRNSGLVQFAGAIRQRNHIGLDRPRFAPDTHTAAPCEGDVSPREVSRPTAVRAGTCRPHERARDVTCAVIRWARSRRAGTGCSGQRWSLALWELRVSEGAATHGFRGSCYMVSLCR